MASNDSISLVDNTAPQQSSGQESAHRASTVGRQGTLTKHLSRTSVQSQLAKRKFAKWQPDKLGLSSTDTEISPSRESSRVRGSISGASSAAGPSALFFLNEDGARSGEAPEDASTADFASSQVLSQTDTSQSATLKQQTTNSEGPKARSKLDVLYENQRGTFFFGIPLYSHSSLLNFDPGAWMTQDRRESAVNITNAQVPDPSWQWAWKTWYVDMSGDVDDQGWQYAFSFGSSQWHGTHPWFHSFVRRRRWVRLRHKITETRRGRSDYERSHMLNDDYFTIHSSRVTSRSQSVAGLSRVESGFLSRVSTKMDEQVHLEEIDDIPSLMHELKLASIDREKIEVLKKFVQNGAEELYYLNDRVSCETLTLFMSRCFSNDGGQIPEIMSLFLFQTSRWQFVTYLVGIAQQLSKEITESDDDNGQAQRKKENLVRVIESARSHITGPEVFTDDQGESAVDLLDLTPVSRHDTLLAKKAETTDDSSRVLKGKEIKGIPKAAQVGREWHIY
ncbi:uncharacterized protein N7477_000271 [Penicillium maclennaniae]|uniref:uncharacterized protein n=1 Tax=Penicillium maclennaniae TaxID=1343394 RepID=UPI002540FC42|nr:uncharacterized protein N7477_000271 [Penicillium maclennaniae]KAJ5683926.1 hypothetical protein N7477_000271 [Penicillium maclennaniae]